MTALPTGYRSGGDSSGEIIMKPYANLMDVMTAFAIVFKD